MKTLVLLSLSLAVALGMPPNPPGVPQSPALTEENQKSLDGVWVPVQAGVALEDPAEKVREEQDGGAKTDVGPDVEEEPGVKTDVESEADLSSAEAEMTRDVQEEIQEEGEPETEEEMEERHMDMERRYETVGEPIMELEPLDDDNTENLLRKDPLPEEEIKDRDNVLDGEPIMELEPLEEDLSDVEKSLKAAFNNQNPVLGEEAIMELEPLDDDNMEKSLREEPVNQPLPEEEIMEERHNVLDEEPIMELEPLDDNNNMEKSLREEQVNPPLPEEEEEEVMKDDVLDGEPIMELEPLEEDLSDVEKSLKAAFNNQNPVLGEEAIMELEPEEPAVMEEEGGADVTGQETPV